MAQWLAGCFYYERWWVRSPLQEVFLHEGNANPKSWSKLRYRQYHVLEMLCLFGLCLEVSLARVS